ncbi:MAG: hypothetical protein ACRCST_07950 [Turicibacter sp.]
MLGAIDVFEMAVSEIKLRYVDFLFMVERDVAWTIQRKMLELIETFGLPYEVYQDYPRDLGDRIRNHTELVIVAQGVNYKDVMSGKEPVELLAKIKYEPSKYRHDVIDYQLPHNKTQVIIEDIKAVEMEVHRKKAKTGVALLIDEGGRHRQKIGQTEHTQWREWGNYDVEELNVNVLVTQF